MFFLLARISIFTGLVLDESYVVFDLGEFDRPNLYINISEY